MIFKISTICVIFKFIDKKTLWNSLLSILSTVIVFKDNMGCTVNETFFTGINIVQVDMATHNSLKKRYNYIYFYKIRIKFLSLNFFHLKNNSFFQFSLQTNLILTY